jgi:hypothetical protein
MSKTGKKNPRKSRGQAAVEFALVLPLLILVVVGLIEAGRAMFIYSSVTNASREASRYGSAFGLLPDETTAKFQDCAGMRNAARKAGFYTPFPDDAIVINYDKGIKPKVNPDDPVELNDIPAGFDTTCDGDADLNVALECGDRILVTITYTYSPILSLIPLTPQNIVSSSARTFLGVITLEEGFTCGSGGGG